MRAEGRLARLRSVALVLTGLATAACAPASGSPGRPAELAPAREALPARVSIPALRLDARVAPVGLRPDGAIDVPGTADEVGWYELGARPGERGNAVLAGHNVWNGRAGVFAGLERLRPGDGVVVTTSMRARFPYVVESVRRYAASSAPIDEVFDPTDEPTLTLLTCVGGPDPNGDYPERLVVRARARR